MTIDMLSEKFELFIYFIYSSLSPLFDVYAYYASTWLDKFKGQFKGYKMMYTTLIVFNNESEFNKSFQFPRQRIWEQKLFFK